MAQLKSNTKNRYLGMENCSKSLQSSDVAMGCALCAGHAMHKDHRWWEGSLAYNDVMTDVFQIDSFSWYA